MLLRRLAHVRHRHLEELERECWPTAVARHQGVPGRGPSHLPASLLPRDRRARIAPAALDRPGRHARTAPGGYVAAHRRARGADGRRRPRRRPGRARRGQRAVVVGGGPIGLLVAAVARETGADVLLVEPNDARRQLADIVGLRTLDPRDREVAAYVEEWTEGAGAEVSFEVSGRRRRASRPQSMRSARAADSSSSRSTPPRPRSTSSASSGASSRSSVRGSTNAPTSTSGPPARRRQDPGRRSRHRRRPPRRDRSRIRGARARDGDEDPGRLRRGRRVSFDLTGKVALVTGCRRGIGLAMADALAAAGADIVGVSLNIDSAGSEAQTRVEGHGRALHGLPRRSRIGGRCRAAGRLGAPRRARGRHPRQQRGDDRACTGRSSTPTSTGTACCRRT